MVLPVRLVDDMCCLSLRVGMFIDEHIGLDEQYVQLVGAYLTKSLVYHISTSSLLTSRSQKSYVNKNSYYNSA